MGKLGNNENSLFTMENDCDSNNNNNFKTNIEKLSTNKH